MQTHRSDSRRNAIEMGFGGLNRAALGHACLQSSESMEFTLLFNKVSGQLLLRTTRPAIARKYHHVGDSGSLIAMRSDMPSALVLTSPPMVDSRVRKCELGGGSCGVRGTSVAGTSVRRRQASALWSRTCTRAHGCALECLSITAERCPRL